jgi:hypothetical protein
MHLFFGRVTILGDARELETLCVVLELFTVNFIQRRRFELQTFLVFALFPKKSGQPESQENGDRNFPTLRVQQLFERHT